MTQESAPVAKKEEDWMSKRWRPAMGWLYMTTCTMDFIVFPVLWAIIQTATHQQVTQWNPITLQGAGLYHLAMGAICGVAAWSRGQEKMAGASSIPNMTGMGGMNKMPISQSSSFSQSRPISRSVLPDTDMEDADRRIR